MKKWLSNLQLTKKLLVSPLMVLFFLIVVGAVSYVGFSKQQSALDDIYKSRFRSHQAIAFALIDLGQIRTRIMSMYTSAQELEAMRKGESGEEGEKGETAGGPAEGSGLQMAQDGKRQVLAGLEKASAVGQLGDKSSTVTNEEKTRFAQVKEDSAKLKAAAQELIDKLATGSASDAQSAVRNSEMAFDMLEQDLYSLLRLEERLAETQYASAGVTHKMSVGAMVVILVAAVVLSLAIIIVMKALILSPLKRIIDGMGVVAEGDLTSRIEVASNDEIGDMAQHFNVLADKLHQAITHVAESSSKVSSAAETLDGATEQMAAGVEEAAVQVAGVASASEEMSKTSAEIARSCMAAVASSETADSSAKSGKKIIEATITAMNRINDHVRESAEIIRDLGTRSDQIGQIVGLINDVADQTNLLALNAAIEAARAGEHGRGFAVVADEVRKLAERTSTATKEISDTIHAMQAETKKAVSSMEQGVVEVDAGAEEAAKSGEALEGILEEIKKVTGEINQIAVASEEETATTNEIAKSIQQISGTMKETAVKIQENSRASSELSSLAKELEAMVDRFKLVS